MDTSLCKFAAKPTHAGSNPCRWPSTVRHGDIGHINVVPSNNGDIPDGGGSTDLAYTSSLSDMHGEGFVEEGLVMLYTSNGGVISTAAMQEELLSL